MADPVSVIVVSGIWVKKQRFVFNHDKMGCRVVQLEAETTHDRLLKLVVDDYRFNQSTHQLRLSYMFSNKTQKICRSILHQFISLMIDSCNVI